MIEDRVFVRMLRAGKMELTVGVSERVGCWVKRQLC